MSAFEGSSGSNGKCDLSGPACSAYSVVDVTQKSWANFESRELPRIVYPDPCACGVLQMLHATGVTRDGDGQACRTYPF